MYQSEIRKCNAEYRNGCPSVSDEEYDLLMEDQKALMAPEAFEKFITSLTEVSGDVKFGDYVIGSLKKLKHGEDDVVAWTTKNNIKAQLFVSSKIDGVSFVASYRNGKMTSCASRGDGELGTDWFTQARYILPETINDKSDIDIRGEFTLTGDSHIKLGFKNRRNGTTGTMGAKTIDPIRLSHVRGYAYQILSGDYNITEQFRKLREIGFNTAAYCVFRIDSALDDNLSAIYAEWRSELEYDIDGLVLSGTDFINENDQFFPSKKTAYKINSTGIPVKVLDIEWKLTKGRLYFPTYIIEPTEFEGSEVSRVTGNNTRFVMDLGVGIGSEILIIKSGAIIPKVIGVVTKMPYEFPTHCPECGTEFVWNQVLDTKTKELVDGVHLMCPNEKCGETRRVEAFVKALDIENVSYKRLVDWNILTFDALLKFVPDRKAKLQVAFYEDLLKKMFNRSRKEILRSMSFDGFGSKLFDKLYDHCGKCIDRMNDLVLLVVADELPELPESIGWRTISKMYSNWFVNCDILKQITTDPRYREPEEKEIVTMGYKLTGSFLVTGSLSRKRDEFEQMVIENGGTIASGVTKNLNYLIVGEKAGGKLTKAEKLGTVQILNEGQFMELIS